MIEFVNPMYTVKSRVSINNTRLSFDSKYKLLCGEIQYVLYLSHTNNVELCEMNYAGGADVFLFSAF